MNIGSGTLDGGQALTVSGTGVLTHTTGTLDVSSLSYTSSDVSTLGSGVVTVTGSLTMNGTGSLTQTGVNGANTQSVGSISVSNGTLSWDSGSAGGTLVVGGVINQSGGTLSLGAKSVSVSTLNITGGSLALGSATINVSSAPNVITGTTSITDGSSTITLNGAGDLTLDTNHSIGNLVVAADTNLIGGGLAKNVTVNASYELDLDSSSNPVILSISAGGNLTVNGTLKVTDSTNTVTINSQTPGTQFNYSGTDIDYNNLALTIADINAPALATTIASSTVNLSSKVLFSSITMTGTALNIAVSTTIDCGNISADPGTIITNAGSNTITASGNVTILGTFNNPANSTLVMTGTGKTLTAVPQIGSLHIGTGTTGTGSGPTAAITLGSDLQLAGNMEINYEGSLDVATYNITISGSYWFNRVGTWDPVDVAEPIGITQSRFEPGTRTVTINPLGSEFIIYGNNRGIILPVPSPVQL